MKWMRTSLGVLVVVIVIALLWLPLLRYGQYRAYQHLVDGLEAKTGMNSYLAQALVALWLLPVFVGLKLYFTPENPFADIPWSGRKRNRGKVILIAQLLTWNVGHYWLTKDQFFDFRGRPLRYYAITPAGVKYYDRAGFDTTYGTQLKPVTPEVVANLKLLENGDSRPSDPSRLEFFNLLTGEPQVWYHKESGGVYRFYRRPGFDPMTGETLFPVTRAVYEEWRASQTQAHVSAVASTQPVPSRPETTDQAAASPVPASALGNSPRPESSPDSSPRRGITVTDENGRTAGDLVAVVKDWLGETPAVGHVEASVAAPDASLAGVITTTLSFHLAIQGGRVVDVTANGAGFTPEQSRKNAYERLNTAVAAALKGRH